MKLCFKCRQLRPHEEFFTRKGSHDGLENTCKICRGKMQRKRYSDKSFLIKEKARLKRLSNRLLILNYYSNGMLRCGCCGESRLQFLGIDHVGGGGHQHKVNLHGHLHIWIIRNNFPEGFRVLCHNCNQSYGAYGWCPHTALAKMSGLTEDQTADYSNVPCS